MTMSTSWRAQYPFASHELRLDGHRYHYLDEGAGRPLVLVHGNPTWSFYWRHLIVGLRDRYRLVAPDHIGCGLSDKPTPYPYGLEQHAHNLGQLLQHLDLQDVTLVVHDWGGAIGLQAAVAAPQRIRRLVLFNTGAFPPPYVPLRIRLCRTPLVGPLAVRGLNAFARAALWMATSQRRRFTPEVRAGYLAPYDTWRHRVAIQRFVDDIPLTRRHPTWKTLATLEQGLSQLSDRPAMIIWGADDWCFRRSCCTRLQRHLPHAELHWLEHAGHYVVEDAHERILPLLTGFLTATEPQPAERH